MSSVETSRSCLYDLVWLTPIHQLAKQYGLSDVGFAKICKRHNIPRPPRGYWARLAAGQSPPQTPLPDPDNDEVIQINANTDRRDPLTTDPEIQSKIEAVQKSKSIEVPKSLRNPHPLVARSLEILELCSSDRIGILESSSAECLDVKVAPDSLRRALRIMQALIRGLESSGASFEVIDKKTMVVVKGERLRFGISEIIE